MASIRITIETDGTAFQDSQPDPGYEDECAEFAREQEIGRILHTLADEIWSNSLRSASLADLLHDNTVGKVEVIE